MATFSEKDGYTVSDLLHFGFGHVDAARSLFQDDPAFFDSAGYLAHLGTELVLKAWHLLWFSEYADTHDLATLYKKIKEKNDAVSVSASSEEFLSELQNFYQLRYPCRAKGPVEVGSDHLEKFNNFLDDLWAKLPSEMVEVYEKLDRTRKGGRVLMRKKIDASEKAA